MGIEWETPRGLRSVFWVLISSRSGNNKKKQGVTQVIMGNGERKSVYKNDLMQHGECVLHKVVILFTFERFSEYLFLPFLRGQTMQRFPKNIRLIPTRWEIFGFVDMWWLLVYQHSKCSAIIPVIFFYQTFVGQKLVTVLGRYGAIIALQHTGNLTTFYASIATYLFYHKV